MPAEQNFANHARLVPGYHFITAPLVLTYLAWSIARVVNESTADHWHALVGAMALTGVYIFARLFPLRTQDRLIRLEERLRLTRILPADLQPHIDSIRTNHLIAIRFAPDEEVPELVRTIIADPSITTKAIKTRIRNWKADHLRV